MSETLNPIETVMGTPGTTVVGEDEKKVEANLAAETREHGSKDAADHEPGEADAPLIPKAAEPSFE